MKMRIGSLVFESSKHNKLWEAQGGYCVYDGLMQKFIEDGTATPVREPRTVEVEFAFNGDGVLIHGAYEQISVFKSIASTKWRGTLTEVIE